MGGNWGIRNEVFRLETWNLKPRPYRQRPTTKHTKKGARFLPLPYGQKFRNVVPMKILLFGHHPDMLSLPVVFHDHNGIRSCGQA